MSIALQAEREAIRRYSDLRNKMHEARNESAAALFKRMIIEEQEHESLLLKWMSQKGIEENPEIGPIKWHDPNVSTTYNDDAKDPSYSTPYRALAFAVHNEEIAFRFYTHVAANSDNKDIREYAEILAREELGHAALLRAERRRAFHLEREENTNEPRLDPKTISNEIDLLTAAIYIDRYLCDQMSTTNLKSPQIDALTKQAKQQIATNEQTLKKISQNNTLSPGKDISRDLQKLDLFNQKIKEQINTDELTQHQILANCDHSFSFYDAIVEITNDEEVMLTAQNLSSTALDRIEALKNAIEG